MPDLETLLSSIPAPDQNAMQMARVRQEQLTKPRGALGRLEAISVWLAGVYGAEKPVIKNKAVIVCAGDHGVNCEGISAYPAEVTPAMVQNFLRGGAGINAIASVAGARVLVVDAGVAVDLPAHPNLIAGKVRRGAGNIAREAAMTKDEAIQAILLGTRAAQIAINDSANLIAAGDMGIGNTTPSSALTAKITAQDAASVVGRGTGANDEMLEHKIKVVKMALARAAQIPKDDALSVLCELGGLEIAAMVGVMLQGASQRCAVLVDCFIAGAAALVACGLEPRTRDFLHATHVSVEPGHRAQLAHLGLEPLFDLGLRLGEGTGAALAMPIFEAAAKTLTEMATFEEASVPDQDEMRN
jgi:nicotinate-nucleotide--dimethylbenzimidazole phosphoribosyltransferase